MKVVADKASNADSLLAELLEFLKVSKILAANLDTYKNAANGRTPPRFIVETSTALKGAVIKDFGRQFPTIADFESNRTDTISSMQRFDDAVYRFGAVQRKIHDLGYVVKTEEDREKLSFEMRSVVADIIVFLCIQFSLYPEQGEETIFMSVSKYCEKNGITKDVFYGNLISDLRAVNRSWYSYEPLSPYYTALQEFDETLASECEDALFPLTDDMAARLINGTLDPIVVRTQLVKHQSSTNEVEVKTNPLELISSMKLE